MITYRIFLILFACFCNGLLAMDSPDSLIKSAMAERGYIFGADLAKEMAIPAAMMKELKDIVEPLISGNGYVVENPGAFDDLSSMFVCRYLFLNHQLYGKSHSINSLENFIKHIVKFIPEDKFSIYAFLISDKAGASPDEKSQSYWHQDKFTSSDGMHFFEYLFFMVIDEESFGNSEIKIGLVEKEFLCRDSQEKCTIKVEEEQDASVSLIAQTPSKANAGYFINQSFINSEGKMIVHRSPALIKQYESSRRYKIILRIKLLPDNWMSDEKWRNEVFH